MEKGESAMIRAECHSDDFEAAAKFDAEPYFADISAADFEELVECEFGGDYAADRVAKHFEDEPGYDGVTELFRYLARGPRLPNGDRVGFECNVHVPDVVAWAEENRPDLYEILEAHELTDVVEGDPDWDSDPSWPEDYDGAAAAASIRR